MGEKGDLAIKGWLAPYTPLATQIEKQINDVGGGRLTAIATDTERNTIRFTYPIDPVRDI